MLPNPDTRYHARWIIRICAVIVLFTLYANFQFFAIGGSLNRLSSSLRNSTAVPYDAGALSLEYSCGQAVDIFFLALIYLDLSTIGLLGCMSLFDARKHGWITGLSLVLFFSHFLWIALGLFWIAPQTTSCHGAVIRMIIVLHWFVAGSCSFFATLIYQHVMQI